jgi:hypothetical protein
MHFLAEPVPQLNPDANIDPEQLDVAAAFDVDEGVARAKRSPDV